MSAIYSNRNGKYIIAIFLMIVCVLNVFDFYDDDRYKSQELQDVISKRNKWWTSSGDRSDRYLIPIASRNHMPLLLQEFDLHTGLEVGVQTGAYALHLLQNWPKCKRYVLVDPWRPIKNYMDFANVDQQYQDKFLERAKKKNWRPIRI